MSAKRQASVTATSPPDWAAIERAATDELQRRAKEAHARILDLLKQHAAQMSETQKSAIRRRLKPAGRA